MTTPKLANLVMTSLTNHDEINKMADKPGIRQVASDAADENKMEQIREILFGEQTRQTADHLARIESQLGKQDAALRALLDERVDELRSHLEAHGAQQRAALDGVESAIRELLGKVDERVTLLDSDLQDAGHRLSQSLDQQAAAHERLLQSSVDRAQLAQLLEGLAQRLRPPPDA